MKKTSLRDKSSSLRNNVPGKITDKIKEINKQLKAEGLFKIKEITDKREFENIQNTVTYWGNEHKFIFVSNLGEKIKIDRLIIEKSNIVRIQALLVRRILHMGIRAYGDGNISLDEYLPISLYNLPYRNPPHDFNAGKETEQIVPGSESIVKCDRCLGEGKVKGRAEDQTCPVCKGSRKVVRYSFYRTIYFPKLFTGVFSPVEIPQEDMTKGGGDYIYDEIIYDKTKNIENAQIELTRFGHLHSAIEKLLDYIKKILIEEENTAIFRIRLSIQDIKLKRVEYIFGDRKQFLHIIGNNNLVYTKKKFIHWGKIFLMVLVGLIILINGLFYTTKTGYFSRKSSQKIFAGEEPSETELITKTKSKIVDKESITKTNTGIITGGEKGIIEKDKEELAYKETIVKRNDLFSKGLNRYRAGEFENAFNDLKAAIELNKAIKNHSNIIPTTADLYFYLGQALMELENYEEAIIAYENALKDNPNHRFAKERLKFAKERLKKAEYFRSILEEKEDYEE